MLSENATWGDAFIPYTADDDSAAEASPYVVDPDEAGTLAWHWMDIYGKQLFGNIFFGTTPDSCTIGSDCDGALVRLCWGGILETTADENVITLPEISNDTTPTAIQVLPGASICVYNRDTNENFYIDPYTDDTITIAGVTNAAGQYVGSTAAATSIGDYICVVATSTTNWTVFGYRTTLIAE
jgi:hypothetical protein